MLRWQAFLLVFLLLGLVSATAFAVVNTRGYYRFGEKYVSGKAQFAVEVTMEDKEGRVFTKRFVPSEYAIWSSVEYPETRVTKLSIYLYLEVTAYAVRKTDHGYFTVNTQILETQRQVIATGNNTPKDMMTRFLDLYYTTRKADYAYETTVEEMGEYTNWTSPSVIYEETKDSYETTLKTLIQTDVKIPNLTDPTWALELSFGFNIVVSAVTLGGAPFSVTEQLIPPSDIVIKLMRMDWGYVTIIVAPPSVSLQTSSFFDVGNTHVLQISLLLAQTISLWLSVVLLILEIRKRLR